jgi:hypothetical protein
VLIFYLDCVSSLGILDTDELGNVPIVVDHSVVWDFRFDGVKSIVLCFLICLDAHLVLYLIVTHSQT